MSDDVRTFDTRQEAILAAIAQVAREGGNGCVWAHQEGCAIAADLDDEDLCDCEPECIEVGPTS